MHRALYASLILALAATQVVAQQLPDQCGRILTRADYVTDGKVGSHTTWTYQGNQQVQDQVVQFGNDARMTQRVIRSMDDLGRIVRVESQVKFNDSPWTKTSITEVEHVDAKRQQIWRRSQMRDDEFTLTQVRTIHLEESGGMIEREVTKSPDQDGPGVVVSWEREGDQRIKTRSLAGEVNPAKTIETYRDGKLVQRIEHLEIHPAQSMLLERLSEGEMLNELRAALQAQAGIEQRRESFEYDGSGNQTGVVKEELQDGTWFKTSEATTEFDACGAVSRKTTVTFNRDGAEDQRYTRNYTYESTDTVELPSDDTPGLLESVYPNPAINSATLLLSESAGSVDVALYDAAGRRLRTIEAGLNGSQRQLTVDVASLPPGVYAIRVNGADRTDTRLLTVQGQSAAGFDGYNGRLNP